MYVKNIYGKWTWYLAYVSPVNRINLFENIDCDDAVDATFQDDTLYFQS